MLAISYVAFSALMLLVGGRKGIWPVKNGGMVEVGRLHCSAYFTLDNQRSCILRDCSSGVEYLDTVRAVF